MASEETIHEYARRKGCFVDHRSAPFRLVDHVNPAAPWIQSADLSSLDLNEDLPCPELPATCIHVNEDMGHAHDQAADDLLRASQDLDQYYIPILPRRLKVAQELKLPCEEIDLGSDAVADLELLARQVEDSRNVDLNRSWLPLSSLSVSKDEALDFPSNYERRRRLLLREIDREALHVNLTALRLLDDIDAVTNTVEPCEYQVPVFDETKIFRRSEITPPLSPCELSDDEQPFIPDAEVSCVDLTSEPHSPTDNALLVLPLDTIDEFHNALVADLDAANSTTPLRDPRNKISDLKFEVPELSLSSDTGCEHTPSRGFVSDIQQFLPLQPSTPNDDLQDPLGEIRGEIEAKGTHAMLLVENESFSTTDSRLRLPVPHLPSAQTEPAWLQHASSADEQFAFIRSQAPQLFKMGNTKLNTRPDLSIKWNPLPHTTRRFYPVESGISQTVLSQSFLEAQHSGIELHTTRIALKSFNGDEHELAEEMTPVKQTITASTAAQSPYFTPTKSGSNQSGSSHIATQSVNPMTNESSFFFGQPPPAYDSAVDITRDRPGTPSDSHLTTTTTSPGPRCKESSEKPARGLRMGFSRPGMADSMLQTFHIPERKLKAAKAARGRLPTASALLGTGDQAATGDLLQEFMHLRGQKMRALTDGQPRNPSIPTSRNRDEELSAVVPQHLMAKAKEIQIKLPAEKAKFIISLDLPRQVIRQLEKHWSRDNLFDRDYAQHIKSASVSDRLQSMVIAHVCCDADISLSPTVGIIVTTLAAAIQGSGELTPLRKRIMDVSTKYETLYVLVSEDNEKGEYQGVLSPELATSYAAFVQFTSALPGECACLYVPGKEETLVNRIISIMCRYSAQMLPLSKYVAESELSWELFFRRTGMNVMASQLLSGRLAELGPHGLAMFLTISTQRKIQEFAGLLGGPRALVRVSQVLDRRWS